MAEDAYLASYADKFAPLTLNGDVDAISGSTVSSRALLEAVNTAQNLLFGKGSD